MPTPATKVLRVLAPSEAPSELRGELHFDAIYNRYAPYVANIALRVLGRQSEVDDVVQDVFVDAFRSMDRLREPAKIRGWLSTVAVRKASRRLRGRKVREWLGLSRDVASYETLAHPGASAEQRAMLAAVYRALDALPVRERLPWTLRYIEGERLAAVAELCECSLATAKRRIAAAHTKIKEACSG